MADLRFLDGDYERRFDDVPPVGEPAKKPNGNGHAKPAPSRIQSSQAFVQGFKPPDYVLDGILQRGYLYSLTAMTGAGKTALTLLIMAHMALGRAIGGRDVQKGAVLMLAGENPDDVRMRWMGLAEYAGFDEAEIDAHFLPGTVPILDSFEDIIALASRVGGLSFISVDTSAAYFQGEDENSNPQLLEHAKTLRRLTEIPGHPCVVANCHPVKHAAADNLLPRGGGSFLNEMDGNLCCTKEDTVVELYWQGKFRGPEFEPIAFELVPVTSQRLVDSRGKLVPTVVARTITSFEQESKVMAADADSRTMLKLIEEGPGKASMVNLAERAGWLMGNGQAYKVKAQRVLLKLKREHLVSHDLDVWELTPKGQKVLRASV